MSITLIKPGWACSVQDLGRWGYQEFGIPLGGAMDVNAAMMANRICGNKDGEALLECTLHGTEIQLNETAVFSFTGGGAIATVNGQPVTFNKQIKAVGGSTIKLLPSPFGCRTYIAFAGGLKVNRELGSCSTCIAAGIGGYNGRNLESGDLIELKKIAPKQKTENITISAAGFGSSNWKAIAPELPHVNDLVRIKCYEGPEWNLFDEASKHALFNTPFAIGQHANRMGFQLEGARLTKKENKEMISSAVTKGIVQVTYQGTPIILMTDAQTIGGYPRIGRIFNDDIHLLAQCRPGMKIQLIPI